MSYWQEKQSIEWTTVIGNGKRMARKWRQQKIQRNWISLTVVGEK